MPTSDPPPVSSARAVITRALACFDQAQASRLTCRYRTPSPKFKPLVLMAAPDASVRRVGSCYECFIGGERIRHGCEGAHPTPDKAWLCLARFVVTTPPEASQ